MNENNDNRHRCGFIFVRGLLFAVGAPPPTLSKQERAPTPSSSERFPVCFRVKNRSVLLGVETYLIQIEYLLERLRSV